MVITLTDGQNPLNNTPISINIGSGAKTYTTNNNGQVKITTSGLIPKTYTVNVTFEGNGNYMKSSINAKIVVNKATPKLTAKAATFKKSAKTKTYTVTLKTNKNIVMKNTQIKLTVNKKTFTAKTNSKGVATFKINNLNKKGKFTATIKYAGSKYYKNLSKNIQITVK